MAKVFLGIGSNIQPKRYIRQALTSLQTQFGTLQQSPIYESEAIGFDGDNFLNLVVSTNTELSIGNLQQYLKNLENQNNRDRNAVRFSGRTLDIDILLYDDIIGTIDGVTLPRDEILKNAFVLKPLSDLAPDLQHPENHKSMAQLWIEYDSSRQKLWPTTIAD
jgi:2-amino-4-hydroxy-6-hydroxymethyldihydropteridine diphosphokinase